jgi:hypothetical protein
MILVVWLVRLVIVAAGLLPVYMLYSFYDARQKQKRLDVEFENERRMIDEFSIRIRRDGLGNAQAWLAEQPKVPVSLTVLSKILVVKPAATNGTETDRGS